ncbi:receptor-type tyrosine-protein phosphatase kappa-like [Glandiceps talaboti]
MAHCLARGCCFDDRTPSDVPNCYQANGCDYNTFKQDGICTNCNCLQPCDRTTGECSSMCVNRFIGLNCQTDGLPSVSSITQDMTVNSGQPTNFTCSVQANIRETVHVTIETESNSYTSTSTTNGVHPNYVHKHTFNDVSVTKGENVTCNATYSGGTPKIKVIEAVSFVQPQLKTEPWITYVNKMQMIVNWNTWQSGFDIGDGMIEKYEVWYKNTSENSFTSYPQDVNPNQTSLAVDGLLPYTDYMFAVKTYRPGVGGGGDLGPHTTGRTPCGNPLGSPVLLEANTPTSSEMEVIWELNEADLEPHRLKCDEVTSYTVHYRVNGSNTEYKSITADSDVTSEILTKLNPCTTYEVTVTMNNEAGGGPYSNPVINKTMPSPPKVKDLTANVVSSYIIQSTWSHPENTNPDCPLEGYELVYEQISEYDCGPTKKFTSHVFNPDTYEHNVNGLYANTEYSVRVTAFISSVIGTTSVATETTSEAIPSQPLNLQTIGVSATEVQATWYPPQCPNGILKTYVLFYWETLKDETTGKQLRYNVDSGIESEGSKNMSDVIDGLNPGTNYTVQVTAENSCCTGNRSDAATAATKPISSPPTSTPVAMMVSGVVGGLVVVLLLLVLLGFLYLKRTDKSLSDVCRSKKRPNAQECIPIVPVAAEGLCIKPIKIQDLVSNIKRKKASDADGFKAEYESLPSDDIAPYTFALTDVNKLKNRFTNIMAYDHSRVILGDESEELTSDYINASYINGYTKKKAYIATQGPKTTTVADLWRMVWQEKSACILMATNLMENNKEKCVKYWPDQPEGEKLYGDISVKNVCEEVFVDSMIRTLHVKKVDQTKVREIKQFHFTVWPDMGVPQYPSAVLSFLRRIRAYNPSNAGPLVVHCSAGVGRTGTFITIDSMLEMAEAEGKVDIFNFVYQARQDRMHFVQTLDQYKFAYTAVLEAIVFGNKEIPTADLRMKLTVLKIKDKGTNLSALDKEFRVLNEVCCLPNDSECSDGRQAKNKSKNRYTDVIPIDRCRPRLTTPVYIDGSTDYINASFLTAYTRKDALIATQMPMSHTIVDFWRMVYDYMTNTIVMLNDMDSEDMRKGQYWCDEKNMRYGPFEVEVTQIQDNDDIIERIITLSNHSSKRHQTVVKRTITHLQLTTWPANREIPYSTSFLSEMVTLVEKAQQQSDDNRITVHCRNGLGRSGVFCAFFAAYGQVKMEQIVNVFQAVKTIRENRPQMVETVAQYQYIYDALLAYLDSFATSANFE